MLLKHVICFKDKAELLKRWVSCGENLQSCEHTVKTMRTNSQQAKRVRVLVSVKDMPHPPYRFSKLLVCKDVYGGASCLPLGLFHLPQEED